LIKNKVGLEARLEKGWKKTDEPLFKPPQDEEEPWRPGRLANRLYRFSAASSRSDNEKVDKSWRIQDQASRAGRCGNG